ncbi:MAG TPA: RNA 2',3'-cyclic phosphodiesterase [Polyangiaceae bacterium]|jgi:2'-5' RNA ligase
MARLFFAVATDPAMAGRLRAVQDRLAAHEAAGALRFSVPEQAHYTLRFLGEQGPERREAATRAAMESARLTAAFEVVVDGRGVFPDERRAHTLWIGVDRGVADLSALARRIDERLAGEGFEKADHTFVAHMTLARIKRRLPADTIRSLLATSEPLGTMRVDEFALFESRPSPRGAVYVALEKFRLSAS